MRPSVNKGVPGFTIAEVLVSFGILAVMSAICFGIYALGLRSWTKVDAKTEVLATLQVVQAKIAREVRASQMPSISVALDNSGIAFLSAGPENSRLVDGGGRLQWQYFVFYYYDPVTDEVYRKEVPYAPLDPTLQNTLEAYSGQPLATHKFDGQVVGRGVLRFQAILENPDILNLLLQAESGNEQMVLNSSYQLSAAP